MNQKIKIILKSVFVLVLFTLSLSVFAVWQPPTVAPTGGNPEPPINVGGTLQYKPGSIVADGLRAAYSFLTDATSVSTFNGSAIFNSSVSVGNPAGTQGAINTGSTGIYVYNGGSRFINLRANGTVNDLQSSGAPLVINFGSTNQNVGIGTNGPPGAKLEVGGQVKITGGSPGAGKVLTSDATGLASWATPTGGTNYWTLSAPNLYSSAAYNVGIGTTSAGAKLEVAGQVKITGGAPGAGKVLTSDATGLASWVTPINTTSSGTANRTARWVPTVSTPVLGSSTIMVDNGTNIGIGTGTTVVPTSKLFITGGDYKENAYDTAGFGANQSSYALGAQSIAANDSIYSYGAICTGNNYGNCKSSGGTVIGIPNTSATNNIPNAGNILFNSGNVGIGTVSPTAKLHVEGVIRIAGGQPGANKVLTSSDSSGLASWVSPEWVKNGAGVFYGKNVLITNSNTTAIPQTGWWLESTGVAQNSIKNDKFAFINKVEAAFTISPRLNCDNSDYEQECGTFYLVLSGTEGSIAYDKWGECPLDYEYSSGENCTWSPGDNSLPPGGAYTTSMTVHYNQYEYGTKIIGSSTSENTTNLEVGSINTGNIIAKKVTTTGGQYFNGKFYSNNTYSCSPVAGLHFEVTVSSNGFSSKCYGDDFFNSGTVSGLHAYARSNPDRWCSIGTPTYSIRDDGLSVYGSSTDTGYGLITIPDKIIGVGRYGGNTLTCSLLSP